jgi:hypothetical protein
MIDLRDFNPPQAKWYGFSRKTFLGGLRIFCTIAIVLSVLSVVASFVEGIGVRNWTALIVLLAIMPGIWLTGQRPGSTRLCPSGRVAFRRYSSGPGSGRFISSVFMRATRLI